MPAQTGALMQYYVSHALRMLDNSRSLAFILPDKLRHMPSHSRPTS